MHIVPNGRIAVHGLTGGLVALRAYCGAKLRPGQGGASRNAPLCPTCQRKAGWKTDKRRDGA